MEIIIFLEIVVKVEPQREVGRSEESRQALRERAVLGKEVKAAT